MREFKKSVVILYINLVFAIILVAVAIICFTLMNKTTMFIGIDLYLIFGIVFILFALPFIVNIINYLLLPKLIMTIYQDKILLHKRKRDIQILNRKLLGVSKNNSFNFIYGLDVGTLKLLVNDDEKPYYIKCVDEIDKVYQIIHIIILEQYNQIVQKKSTSK